MLSVQGIYNTLIHMTLLHVLGPVYASFAMLQLICYVALSLSLVTQSHQPSLAHT